MSAYKVSVVCSNNPDMIFDDGSFIFEKNDIVHYCKRDFVVALGHRWPGGTDLLKKINGRIYVPIMLNQKGCVVEYDIINNKLTHIEVGINYYNTIVINNTPYFADCTHSSLRGIDGNIYYINHRNIIYSDSRYHITAKVHEERRTPIISAEKVSLDFNVYIANTFEKIYETTQVLPLERKYEHGQVVTPAPSTLNIKELVKNRIVVHEDNLIQLNGELIKIKIKEKKICKICQRKPKPEGLLVPCKHRGLCYACIEKLTECPICNELVAMVIKL